VECCAGGKDIKFTQVKPSRVFGFVEVLVSDDGRLDYVSMVTLFPFKNECVSGSSSSWVHAPRKIQAQELTG
jgi:hypothetical protein